MRASSRRSAGIFVLAVLPFMLLFVTASRSAQPVVRLAGTWDGSVNDNTGPGKLSLTLRQDGPKVSGSALAYDPDTRITIQGSVKGTLNGKVLTGEIDYSYLGCKVNLSFEAKVSGQRMSGTYSGFNSCSGYIKDGHLLLKRK